MLRHECREEQRRRQRIEKARQWAAEDEQRERDLWAARDLQTVGEFLAGLSEKARQDVKATEERLRKLQAEADAEIEATMRALAKSQENLEESEERQTLKPQYVLWLRTKKFPKWMEHSRSDDDGALWSEALQLRLKSFQLCVTRAGADPRKRASRLCWHSVGWEQGAPTHE
jgi:hypothetical protein